MSYSIWLRRFDRGNTVPMDQATFQTVTSPHVARQEPEHNFLLLRMPDGGEADVYANTDPDGSLGSVMLTHFCRGLVLGVVAELANALEAAVLLQEGIALVSSADQRANLVPELQQDAVIIELSGEAIQAVIDQL
ncbi:hypothetical protein GCM10009839_17800 [Catenulispora yoronensis]|uniref:Uncharacterized protein n=1 Tax=Catenulispora yoronensis TaxID=450799 RepID=A0ABN2TWA0_9ACTN